MIISILALFTALLISFVSAFFSVTGLVAIFAAAKIQIIILGSALEFGKVITTLLLHRNWKTLSWQLKSYLLPAVFVLMSITSMGIYGGLAKAHIDQQLPTDNVAAQVSVIDTQISATQSDLDSAKANLAQLDSVVNQLMGRSTDTKGAQHASNVRNSQKAERAQLNAEIQKDENELVTLQQQKTPLTVQQNTLSVQSGPLQYIAALVYGNNVTSDELESAVRGVITMLVIVFDPLALVLLLAASSTLETAKKGYVEPMNKFNFKLPKLPKLPNWFKKKDVIKTVETVSPLVQQVEIEPEKEEDIMDDSTPNSLRIMLDNALISVRNKGEEIQRLKALNQEYETKLLAQQYVIDKHESTIELLNKQAVEWSEKHIAVQNERDELQIMWDANKTKFAADAENYQAIMKKNEVIISDLRNEVSDLNAKLIATQRTLMDFQNSNQIMRAEINNLTTTDKIADREFNVIDSKGNDITDTITKPTKPLIFGISFPTKPVKNDFFVITSVFPHELYQWSGTNWTKLDKTFFTAYSQDVDYVNYLINQIASGGCDFDQLLKHEQDAVMQALSTYN